MDKSWVWLPRNSIEYLEGATAFVNAAAKLLGDPAEMFCPCVHCRNLCHQPIEIVIDHIVMKGMDQKYKRNGCWSKHGDVKRSDEKADGPTSESGEFEAYELFRTVFYDGDKHSDFQNQNVSDTGDAESTEDSDFRKKLKEAETPLYSRCQNYTKVSAIMGLYRIKVKSGMSENYFDQLLSLVHDILPGDNVLPTSTNEIKKFLKMFGNVCGKDTPFRWLKFSRKHVYLCNRKRLRPGHPYRRKKSWFDNTIEEGTANRIETGSEIYEILKDFRNDFGRSVEKKSKRKRSDLAEDDVLSEDGNEEDGKWRWKKRSILFELPYWKDMPVRHNIDVMHVEKNVSDALLSILMQTSKSKDGLKARKDLEDMGIRSNLHAQSKGKRTYLPPAACWLSKEEKRRFCNRLSKFRGPDGYCANIANCVSVDPPIIAGLKSHDHHVLLQNLLPVAHVPIMTPNIII